MLTTETPVERAFSGGSGSRLLGFRMPTSMPILKHNLRADIGEALPEHTTQEAMLEGLVNTVDLLTLAM